MSTLTGADQPARLPSYPPEPLHGILLQQRTAIPRAVTTTSLSMKPSIREIPSRRRNTAITKSTRDSTITGTKKSGNSTTSARPVSKRAIPRIVTEETNAAPRKAIRNITKNIIRTAPSGKRTKETRILRLNQHSPKETHSLTAVRFCVGSFWRLRIRRYN